MEGISVVRGAEHQRERALIKQERIANKRNCVVRTVELDRPPWEVDALFGNLERKLT